MLVFLVVLAVYLLTGISFVCMMGAYALGYSLAMRAADERIYELRKELGYLRRCASRDR